MGAAGGGTENAVRAFQASVDQGADGVAGKNTWAAMAEALQRRAGDETAERLAQARDIAGQLQLDMLSWFAMGPVMILDPSQSADWLAEGPNKINEACGAISEVTNVQVTGAKQRCARRGTSADGLAAQ